MSNKVLLTGVSGFLGAAIASELVAQGHEVIGIVRSNSNMWRCASFIHKIKVVNIEEPTWKDILRSERPNVIIHAAWNGVSAADRDNWGVQFQNLTLTVSLLELSNEWKIDTFMGLGSQAEYGLFSGVIDENYPVNPNSAYGLSKHLVGSVVKNYCESKGIHWYWMRLFSFFGEQEDPNWFIPMMITKINKGEHIDMTPGEQKYAYMYVQDLAKNIVAVIEKRPQSDYYNLSSSSAYSLREIVEKIVKYSNVENPSIHFGAMPYRPNQPMHIQGVTTKLTNQIGKLYESNFDERLSAIIKHITQK